MIRLRVTTINSSTKLLYYQKCHATYFCDGTNTMLTGTSIFKSVLVGVRRPVVLSMRKSKTLPVSSLAENKYEPVGSIAKLRGMVPPGGTCSTSVRVPFAGSIANTPIVSGPHRLGPRKRRLDS